MPPIPQGSPGKTFFRAGISVFETRPPLAALCLLFAAYFLAGGFGQGLALIPGVSITFWPPVGILIATLLVAEKRSWPWYVAAGGLAELACNAVWFHNPLGYAAIYFGANALEAMAAAWLILRFAGQPFRLESLREVAVFVLCGAVVAPMVSATIIALTDVWRGKHAFTTAWPLVWLGDGSGLLVSTPLTLACVQIWQEREKLRWPRFVEAAGIVSLLLILSLLAIRGILPTIYVTTPALLWAAVRFQLRGAATSLALVTLMTAVFTAAGRGEFASDAEWNRRQIVMLQSFLGVSAVSALLVAALSRQHQLALGQLKRANAELEDRVSERTERLRRQRERLDLALRTGRLGVHEWNLRDNSLWWSPELYPLFGVEPSSFTPTLESFYSLVHPQDRDELKRITDDGIRQRRPFMHEYRIVRPDGAVRWLYSRSSVALGEDGQPALLIGVAAEVTERKEAEEQLRLQRRLTEEVVQLTPACVAVVRGDDLTYELVNPAYQELYPNRPMVGRTIPDVWPEVAAPFSRLCRKVLDSGEPYVAVDDPYTLGVQGVEPVERRYFTWAIHRIALPAGGSGLLITGWETTSRVKAEQALRDVDRRKDEFLATLAHELRNPLAPVRNAVQVLHFKGPQQPDLQWARDVIDRQVQAMSRLIDDLMDVSRISRGKLELKRERVNLANVIQGAVETSRPLIDEMGHQLTVTLPDRPVMLEADVTRLAQVFLNLLNNAAKYSEPGGRIELHAERQGSDVVVRVTDSGIGIPADKLPTIFEMFSQVDSARGRSQGGLGIGLSLVKRLVEMHHGSVLAASNGPGRGSQFIVRLPVAVDAQAEESLRRDGPSPRPSSRFRVLIVDDNQDAANTLAMLLKAMGNSVCTAYDGEAAVTAAEEFRPQVVLCDIGLPKLDGHQVCRAIRRAEWGKQTILVAVTGWGQSDDRERSLDAGFDRHLVKPVDPKLLMELLASIDAAANAAGQPT